TAPVTANAAGERTATSANKLAKILIWLLSASVTESINSSTPRPQRQNVMLFQQPANARASVTLGESRSSGLRLLYQRGTYTPRSECKLRGDRFRSPCYAKRYGRALQSLVRKDTRFSMNASATRTGRNWRPDPIQILLAIGLFASLCVTLVILIQDIHPAPDK